MQKSNYDSSSKASAPPACPGPGGGGGREGGWLSCQALGPSGTRCTHRQRGRQESAAHLMPRGQAAPEEASELSRGPPAEAGPRPGRGPLSTEQVCTPPTGPPQPALTPEADPTGQPARSATGGHSGGEGGRPSGPLPVPSQPLLPAGAPATRCPCLRAGGDKGSPLVRSLKGPLCALFS